ncbi:hypothetical protein EQG41_08560 [Billgrantia azerbaijanica]|nr:hypothetical protein EQG41_08560 [Halomonas azerbaijanica]
MAESKIEVKLGEISFSGEGDPSWLAGQLDKVLDRAEALMALTPAAGCPASSTSNDAPHQPSDSLEDDGIASKPLAAWLKEKGADASQPTKFLMTAVWLEAKGKNRLQTKDVSGALSKANQKRLSNASDCLIRNVKKGFCEKEGSQFYVTEEGKRFLGMS